MQDLAVSNGLTSPPCPVPCVGTAPPVLSAECFFSVTPAEPWERSVRAGTSPKLSRGSRSSRARPFKQRSVRAQRQHDRHRRHNVRTAATHGSRKTGYPSLTAVVRRAFLDTCHLLAVSLSDLEPPTHQLSFRLRCTV